MHDLPEPYKTLFEAVALDRGPETVPVEARKGADFSYVDPNNGRTLLYAAVRADRIGAVAALLKHGANPNQRFSYLSPVDGVTEADRTALHYASSPEVTAALIKAGADVNAADALGTTPLMCAAFHGDLRVLEALLAAGADPLARQNKNRGRRAASAREMAEVKIRFFENVLRMEKRASAEQRIRAYEKVRDRLLRAENPSPESV